MQNDSLQQIVEKWKKQNERLKTQCKSTTTIQRCSIIAHATREECIKEIEQYLNDVMMNGRVN